MALGLGRLSKLEKFGVRAGGAIGGILRIEMLKAAGGVMPYRVQGSGSGRGSSKRSRSFTGFESLQAAMHTSTHMQIQPLKPHKPQTLRLTTTCIRPETQDQRSFELPDPYYPPRTRCPAKEPHFLTNPCDDHTKPRETQHYKNPTQKP